MLTWLSTHLGVKWRSGFVRSVGILTGGTIFAQGLMALSLPFLTRLYEPADFSVLSVYMAIIGIIATISCMRLNIAVPLPEQDAEGMSLVALSLLAATGVSLTLALPVIVAPAFFAAVLGQPEIAPNLWMIPIGVWIASVYVALQYWASRKKRFGLITGTRVTRAIGGAGFQIGFGVATPGPFGLLFGHMIYGGLGVIGLVRSISKHDMPAVTAVNKTRMMSALYTYRRFPIWSVPEALFNSAGVQLPIIIIAAVAIGPEAGYLLLAMRVLGLPMGLVGSSVAQVYLAEAPQKLREGTLDRFTRKAIWALIKSGGPPLLLAGALSPFLFGRVFGDEWSRAGAMVAWMTPWFILQFAASPVSMVLHVTGHLGTAMALQAVGLAIRVGAVLGAIVLAPDWVVEAYAVSGAVFYSGYLWVVTKVAMRS